MTHFHSHCNHDLIDVCASEKIGSRKLQCLMGKPGTIAQWSEFNIFMRNPNFVSVNFMLNFQNRWCKITEKKSLVCSRFWHLNHCAIERVCSFFRLFAFPQVIYALDSRLFGQFWPFFRTFFTRATYLEIREFHRTFGYLSSLCVKVSLGKF